MPRSKPKILLLTPSPPFPPTNGGILRIFSLVQALKDRFDFTLLTFTRDSGENKFSDAAKLLALENIFAEVHSVPKESITSGRKAAPPLPRIARDWFSPAMASAVAAMSPAHDILHAEFLQMAFYVRYSGAPVSFFTEHDLGHLSLFKSYFREWTGLRRFSEIPEWLRTRAYHAEMCAEYDRVVVLTDFDKKRLAAKMPERRLVLSKTGTNLSRFPFRPPQKDHPLKPLIYVGHYPHFPNEDAALWFCRSIFPLILRRMPGVRLVLAGSQPTAPVSALAVPGGPISVTGEVPDIAPYLAEAGIFVAPVRLGFGIKGKILEAFSAGVPVVATSTVAKGVPEAKNGVHLLTADSPREFAEAVARLRTEFALYERLAVSARSLAEKHYSWDRLSGDLARAYTAAMTEAEQA
jgi:glycosyltransferase involved in cell wall biosynthesis